MKLTHFLLLLGCSQVILNSSGPLKTIKEIEENPVKFVRDWEAHVQKLAHEQRVTSVLINEAEERGDLLAEEDSCFQEMYEKLQGGIYAVFIWEVDTNNKISVAAPKVSDLKVRSGDEIDLLFKGLSRSSSERVLIDRKDIEEEL